MSPPGLGERLLAVGHAGAGALAQVLDHRRADFGHGCSPVLFVKGSRADPPGPPPDARSARATGSRRRRARAARSRHVALADDLDVRARGGAVLARLRRSRSRPPRGSGGDLLPRSLERHDPGRCAAADGVAGAPSMQASAIFAGEELDRADRVVVAGDDVVDAVGVAVGVGDRDDRDAELARLVTAMCSFFGSITNSGGSLVISLMPPRFFSSFSRSRSIWATSLFGSANRCRPPPSSRGSRRRSMPCFTVLKLVSVPPSQRWVTKYWPERVASSTMTSWACFLVPTNRTVPPLAVASTTALSAPRNSLTVSAGR